MQDTTHELGMSETARHWLAGILAHVPALEALCAPTESCYTRHGAWAPAKADWGLDDRMRCVRVQSSPELGYNCFMELRLPSAAANPYLIVAGMVAAGLDGLKRKLPLAPKADPTATAVPLSLAESLAALEADEYMVQALGSTLIRWFGIVKRAEMAAVAEKMKGYPQSDEEAQLVGMTKAMQEMFVEYV